MEEKQIPIYEAMLTGDTEETGVFLVSVVEDPAIRVKGVLLKDVKKRVFFDNERQILIAPALIPDQLIYRNDSSGEYYIKWKADIIQECFSRFNARKGDKINWQHTNEMLACTIMESWIVQKADDKAYRYVEVPIGTWMLAVKFEKRSDWQRIKATNSNSFSIEAFVDLKFLEQFTITENAALNLINKNKITYSKMDKEVIQKTKSKSFATRMAEVLAAMLVGQRGEEQKTIQSLTDKISALETALEEFKTAQAAGTEDVKPEDEKPKDEKPKDEKPEETEVEVEVEEDDVEMAESEIGVIVGGDYAGMMVVTDETMTAYLYDGTAIVGILPEGDYTLEDNSVLSVDANGMLTAITEAETQSKAAQQKAAAKVKFEQSKISAKHVIKIEQDLDKNEIELNYDNSEKSRLAYFNAHKKEKKGYWL